MIEKRENNPYSLFTMLKDTSIMLTRPKIEQDTKILTMIFPPPNSDSVLQVRFCTLTKRIVILTQRNRMLFYRLEKKVSVLEKTIFPEQLRDTENRPLFYQINCLEIGCNQVPSVDVRIQNQKLKSLELQR